MYRGIVSDASGEDHSRGGCRPGKISNRKSNDLVLKRKDEAAGAEWIQGSSAYKKGATSLT